MKKNTRTGNQRLCARGPDTLFVVAVFCELDRTSCRLWVSDCWSDKTRKLKTSPWVVTAIFSYSLFTKSWLYVEYAACQILNELKRSCKQTWKEYSLPREKDVWQNNLISESPLTSWFRCQNVTSIVHDKRCHGCQIYEKHQPLEYIQPLSGRLPKILKYFPLVVENKPRRERRREWVKVHK